MPQLSGIEFAKSSPTTRIIFTTAYSNYAVEGFKVNALDYLLKPMEHQPRALLSPGPAAKKAISTAKANNEMKSRFLASYIVADGSDSRLPAAESA